MDKFFCKYFAVLYHEKEKELPYELYGSSAGVGKKGYWRWAIFAGREKKPALVGCRLVVIIGFCQRIFQRDFFVLEQQFACSVTPTARKCIR
jgi:hypothetical protein